MNSDTLDSKAAGCELKDDLILSVVVMDYVNDDVSSFSLAWLFNKKKRKSKLTL